MLSKDGFKHHLDNIDHNTIMSETYKKQHPELAKRCLEMVDESKQILLNHFEKQQQEIEQLKNRLNHHIDDGERKQEIIYKLQRMREQDKENIETTLYELDILRKKVNPSENSSIDSHFKRIIDTLKNR